MLLNHGLLMANMLRGRAMACHLLEPCRATMAMMPHASASGQHRSPSAESQDRYHVQQRRELTPDMTRCCRCTLTTTSPVCIAAFPGSIMERGARTAVAVLNVCESSEVAGGPQLRDWDALFHIGTKAWFLIDEPTCTYDEPKTAFRYAKVGIC